MSVEVNRLRWRCQRGMLELDHLLGGFLDEAYADASPEIRLAFAELLEMEDADLLDLLTGRRAPETAVQGQLLGLLCRR